jgi:hypothetical protein
MVEYVKEREMGNLNFDERDGYTYTSDNGIRYDILEGVSLGGATTSDMVFVMVALEDVDLQLDTIGGDALVCYTFGATDLESNAYRADVLKYIEAEVSEYELKHPVLVEAVKNANGRG